MKTLLKIDSFIQTMLFFVSLILGLTSLATLGVTGFILGYSLLFLGAWQLLSGFLLTIILKDVNRLRYFLGSVVYVLLLILGVNLLNSVKSSLALTLGFIFIVIIPMVIAYWYLRLTNKTLKELKTGQKKLTENEMESILDSEEVLGI